MGMVLSLQAFLPVPFRSCAGLVLTECSHSWNNSVPDFGHKKTPPKNRRRFELLRKAGLCVSIVHPHLIAGFKVFLVRRPAQACFVVLVQFYFELLDLHQQVFHRAQGLLVGLEEAFVRLGKKFVFVELFDRSTGGEFLARLEAVALAELGAVRAVVVDRADERGQLVVQAAESVVGFGRLGVRGDGVAGKEQEVFFR